MEFNIKEIRQARNLSRQQLGLKANVSRATIWSIETGNHLNIKLDTLESLAKALNVPTSQLIKDDKPLNLKHIDTQTTLTYIKQNLDLIIEKLVETQKLVKELERK